MSRVATGADVRLTLSYFLLIVAGCATTLDGEIRQCRPDVAVSPSSSRTDSELECDIRVEERE